MKRPAAVVILILFLLCFAWQSERVPRVYWSGSIEDANKIVRALESTGLPYVEGKEAIRIFVRQSKVDSI